MVVGVSSTSIDLSNACPYSMYEIPNARMPLICLHPNEKASTSFKAEKQTRCSYCLYVAVVSPICSSTAYSLCIEEKWELYNVSSSSMPPKLPLSMLQLFVKQMFRSFCCALGWFGFVAWRFLIFSLAFTQHQKKEEAHLISKHLSFRTIKKKCNKSLMEPSVIHESGGDQRGLQRSRWEDAIQQRNAISSSDSFYEWHWNKGRISTFHISSPSSFLSVLEGAEPLSALQFSEKEENKETCTIFNSCTAFCHWSCFIKAFIEKGIHQLSHCIYEPEIILHTFCRSP